MISKTEINLARLISAAPNQPNQTKHLHYVATMREQLEQISEERTPDGLPRVSKAKLSKYSEKIEASKLAASPSLEPGAERASKESSAITEQVMPGSPGLRRRHAPTTFSSGDKSDCTVQADASAPVKLDDSAKAHIDKHRKLQEDLTDEMVGLARQLKERSSMMHQSVTETEKILDSTEKDVEQSLASTGRVNVRATDVYSRSSKTSCFTWLVMFLMMFIFVMVVLLIRVTCSSHLAPNLEFVHDLINNLCSCKQLLSYSSREIFCRNYIIFVFPRDLGPFFFFVLSHFVISLA